MTHVPSRYHRPADVLFAAVFLPPESAEAVGRFATPTGTNLDLDNESSQ
jgi:hypothetical protein